MASTPTLTAADLMTTDVETVAPDDDIGEVLGRLARAEFNGFPVVEDGRLVGIVTQRDLVGLFETEDRTLWIPVGFPPFLETLTYAVDVSWDDLDLGIDLLRNTNKPVRSVMTTDLVTVERDATLDDLLDLLADEERDINRVPVTSVEGTGERNGVAAGSQHVFATLLVERVAHEERAVVLEAVRRSVRAAIDDDRQSAAVRTVVGLVLLNHDHGILRDREPVAEGVIVVVRGLDRVEFIVGRGSVGPVAHIPIVPRVGIRMSSRNETLRRRGDPVPL